METKEKIAPDVLAEWQSVRQALESIPTLKETADRAQDALRIGRNGVREAADRYNNARLELFKKHLEELGENWCSVWWSGEGHLVKEPLQPMLIRHSGDREDIIGSHSYDFDDHVLLQACPACIKDQARMWGRTRDYIRVIRVGEGEVPPKSYRPELREEIIDRLIDRRPEDHPERFQLPPRAYYEEKGSWEVYISVGDHKFDL